MWFITQLILKTTILRKQKSLKNIKKARKKFETINLVPSAWFKWFGPDQKPLFIVHFLTHVQIGFFSSPKKFLLIQNDFGPTEVTILLHLSFSACKDCPDAQWENECNNAGDCRDGSCFCDIGFEGYKCQVERTSYYSAPTPLSFTQNQGTKNMLKSHLNFTWLYILKKPQKLRKCQINWVILSYFCGLLRTYELYPLKVEKILKGSLD